MNRTDLEFLLKEKYGYSTSEIFLFFKEYPEILTHHRKYKQEMSPDLFKDINLLKKDYPVDYLIGYKLFLDSKIFLNHKPLVPRPETEYWVDHLLNDGSLANKNIYLDLFAGSGCIGISILKHINNSFVIFSDISNKSLRQIRENLEENSICDDRYKIIKSDIFSKLTKYRFDVILANPPYIAKNETDIGKEIKYEPQEALFADDNGLKIIQDFLSEAHKFLNPKGLVVMEFGDGQETNIDGFLKSNDKYFEWKFYKDQYNKVRWIKILGR